MAVVLDQAMGETVKGYLPLSGCVLLQKTSVEMMTLTIFMMSYSKQRQDSLQTAEPSGHNLDLLV